MLEWTPEAIEAEIRYRNELRTARESLGVPSRRAHGPRWLLWRGRRSTEHARVA